MPSVRQIETTPIKTSGSSKSNPDGYEPSDHIKRILTSSSALVDRPLADARSIRPECYTEPEFFSLEIKHIFRPGWLCVGRESQIPSKGDFFCSELFGEKIILVRGNDGKVKALSSACSHRSALVVEGSGNVSKFRCPYHKWTYDLNGNLISAPFMFDGKPDNRDFDLPSFACETWLGWIMVNLDCNASSFGKQMASLEQDLKPWKVESMVPLCEPVVFDAEYNWKIVCDNQGEAYHLIGTHAHSILPYIHPEEPVFTSDLKTHIKSWFPSHDGRIGPVFGEKLEGIPSDFNGTWSYNIFPNFLFVVTDDFVIWQHQKISGHDHFKHELWVLGYPQVQSDPDMASIISDVREGVLEVEGEDQASFRSVWAGLQTASSRPGPFSDTEKGSWFWQNWILGAASQSETASV